MKRFMLLSGVVSAVIISLTHTWGGTFYVSRKGTNGAGTSWATAWYNLDQIRWSSVSAGDIIYIDGGTSGMSYSGFTSGKGGTSTAPVRIERSTEAGHDGKVSFGNLTIEHPYIIIDGKDRSKFSLFVGGGYGVRVKSTAPGFEFRNVYIWGDFKGSWGSLFYADNRTLLIKGCEFYQTCAEDQIKYRYRGPNGKLTIEDCYFHGLRSIDGRHADALEAWTLNNQVDLVIRRNLFTDNPTDCFMMSDDDFGTLEFCYNVFDNVADAIKIGSAQNMKVYNNVFNSCRDILGSTGTLVKRNNIYCGRGPWSSGTVQVSGGDTKYCLNDIITTNFIAGEGNLRADPLFVNTANAVGPDNIPFTADDGFRVQSGSPAINAGTTVGYSTDIMGNEVSGTVDIGAYEYTNTGVSWQLAEGSWQALPCLNQHYDILGRIIPGAATTGIYLVVPEDGINISKVTVFK